MMIPKTLFFDLRTEENMAVSETLIETHRILYTMFIGVSASYALRTFLISIC